MPKQRKFNAPSKSQAPISRQAVRQMIDSKVRSKVEMKYIDLVLSASTIANTASINLLNGITQGVTATNRLGEQISLREVMWNLQFVGADATNFVRIMIVLDHQPNGATFAIADLLANQPDPFAFRFMDNLARFQILADLDIDLTLTGPDAVHVKGGRKLKGTSYYTGAGNTIAGIKTNALFIVFISDSGAVSHPTVSGDVRLLFTDE